MVQDFRIRLVDLIFKLHGNPKQASYVDLKEEPLARDAIEIKYDGSFVVKAEGAEIITLAITF